MNEYMYKPNDVSAYSMRANKKTRAAINKPYYVQS